MNAERRIQIHLDRWIRLLGLTGFRITWEVLDSLEGNDADIEYDARTAHIRFDRRRLTSDSRIEDTVGHELLHILDRGLGDHERFISRLAPRLRMVRKRASRR